MYLLLRDTHNFGGREAAIIIPLANIRRLITTSTESAGEVTHSDSSQLVPQSQNLSWLMDMDYHAGLKTFINI
jgi:hypothetical protein